MIYKICTEAEWANAMATGEFAGSAVDAADGYIHFSSADQVVETAARHFAGRAGLMLVAVRAEALGPELKWERARGGALFPHLYGPLPLSAVLWTRPLRLDADGRHLLGDLSS